MAIKKDVGKIWHINKTLTKENWKKTLMIILTAFKIFIYLWGFNKDFNKKNEERPVPRNHNVERIRGLSYSTLKDGGFDDTHEAIVKRIGS